MNAPAQTCLLCQGPGGVDREDLGCLCSGCLAAVTHRVGAGGDVRAALFQVVGRLVVAASRTVAGEVGP